MVISPRRYWMVGGAVGLVVGSAVIGLGLTRAVDDTPLEAATHYLGAIPLFAIPGMTGAPEPVVVQVFLAWWPLLGAFFGWLLSRGRAGTLIAATLVPLLIILHVQTKIFVDGQVDDAAESFSYLLQVLIDPEEKDDHNYEDRTGQEDRNAEGRRFEEAEEPLGKN